MNHKLMKTKVCDNSKFHDIGVIPVNEFLETYGRVYITSDINRIFLTAAEYNREMSLYSSDYWIGYRKGSCGGCEVEVRGE